MGHDHSLLKVWVRHSEPVYRAGLAAALGGTSAFEVANQTTSLEFVPVADSIDVVICDLEHSHETEGVIGRAAVVLLIRNPRPVEIHLAFGRGVLGVLASSCSLEELGSAVRAAARGDRFLCRAAARQVANGLTDESLTEREQAVLELLAHGRCNKSIASKLDIAVGTVKTHVRSIMAKLESTTRTQAASVAIARGVIPDPRDEAPSRSGLDTMVVSRVRGALGIAGPRVGI